MNMTTRLELREISSLIPYENNARHHPPEQIEALRASLREFGFVLPVLIDGEGHVLRGHGILQAAAAEGLTHVPCAISEHLSETQRRGYILADNRLAELSTWDPEKRSQELLQLKDLGMDLTLTGFTDADILLEPADGTPFWGDVETESTEEYEAFTEKFKPKLTTDDVYTPDLVYEAVRDWALGHYGLQGAPVIRPFYPGADYQAADYPAGCVVIDNPPFSILSEICRWYQERNVPFFLFAPGLTLFSIASGTVHYLPVGVSITYTNGASIATSFVTNLGAYRIELAPDLYEAVDTANAEALAALKGPPLPVYDYPACVASVAINKLVKYGQALRIRENDAIFIRALDAQKDQDKAIFGDGFLLSEAAAAEKAAAEKAAAEKAAAEKAAAEKAAAVKWPLSDRERDLQATLGGDGHA